MAAKKMIRCTCSSFEFGTFDVDTDADYGTGCDESTFGTFAMGHDAKLVGFMVRAELGGEEIRQGGVTFTGAVQAAQSISDKLAAKAQAQLDAARARIAKKELRAATRTAKASKKAAAAAEAPKPTTRNARIKIGRWTYDAVINMAEQYGLATYTTKLGQIKTVTSDKYTEM